MTIVLAIIALLCLLIPVPGLNREQCVRAWHEFGHKVQQGDLAGAHAMLTSEAQAQYPMATFTNAAIVNLYPNLLDSPVTRFRSRPLFGSASFLAGGQNLTLPLWMEDGFIAAVVKMKEEDGIWKLKLPVVHAR